jgi:hypothetical protein
MSAKVAVLDLLEEWEARARASTEENDDEVEVELAERMPSCGVWLLEAANAGDMWQAIEAALWYGRLAAAREARSEIRSAHLKGQADLALERIDVALNLWPTHYVGKRIRAAATKGGLEQGPKNRKAPPSDVLQREVDEYRAKGETLTNARRRVASAHELSLSTVRNHTK